MKENLYIEITRTQTELSFEPWEYDPLGASPLDQGSFGFHVPEEITVDYKNTRTLWSPEKQAYRIKKWHPLRRDIQKENDRLEYKRALNIPYFVLDRGTYKTYTKEDAEFDKDIEAIGSAILGLISGNLATLFLLSVELFFDNDNLEPNVKVGDGIDEINQNEEDIVPGGLASPSESIVLEVPIKFETEESQTFSAMGQWDHETPGGISELEQDFTINPNGRAKDTQ